MWPRVSDRRVSWTLIGALIALTWLSLWAWGRSPYGRFLSHEELGTPENTNYVLIVILFAAGWTAMTVAMMLPTSLPLVGLFHSFVRTRPNRAQLTALLITGYICVWSLFGLVVHLGDRFVHEAVDRSAWLGANAWVIGAGTVLLAGMYQFSSLKYRCLDDCRSPLSFIMGNWHGGRARHEAFRLGIHHGIFCLGCCWSLMLLMFAVGVGNIAWMLALGAVMAIEKNVSWGRRLSTPLGVLLLGFGVGLAVTQTSLAG
jgi:predicted metal-binding membrane protein